jgi:hypothetical protein
MGRLEEAIERPEVYGGEKKNKKFLFLLAYFKKKQYLCGINVIYALIQS